MHPGWVMLTEALKMGQAVSIRQHGKSQSVTAVLNWAEQQMTGLSRMSMVTGTFSQPFLRSIKRKGWIDSLCAAYASSLLCCFCLKCSIPCFHIKKSIVTGEICTTVCIYFMMENRVSVFTVITAIQSVHWWLPGLFRHYPFTPLLHGFPTNLKSSLSAEKVNVIFQ